LWREPTEGKGGGLGWSVSLVRGRVAGWEGLVRGRVASWEGLVRGRVFRLGEKNHPGGRRRLQEDQRKSRGSLLFSQNQGGSAAASLYRR